MHLLLGNFRLNLGFETALDSRSYSATADDLILEDSVRLHALTLNTDPTGHEVLLGWLVTDIDDIVCGFRSMRVS